MALDRLVNIGLRGAELVFAAIVAGVNGHHLHRYHHASNYSLARLIYTEVVAAFSIFLALIWLVPFSWSFVHWPVDIVISLCWWAAFGLLVNMLHGDCGGAFDWKNVHPIHGDECGKFKADIAFSFLSALFWLVSALLGLYFIHRHNRGGAKVDAAAERPHHHRRWYRRSNV